MITPLLAATSGLIPNQTTLTVATQGLLRSTATTRTRTPGGGWFLHEDQDYPVSDPRYLDFLYKEQEPLIESIEEIETDVEFEQPEILIQRPPIEYRAMPLHDIEDVTEREIASLMRKIAIEKHATRAIEQAKKEALFNKNKQVMLMLILEES